MDTQKTMMAVNCDIFSDLQGQHLVVGTKQLRKALQSGRANQVYLAMNADPALTQPIAQLCQKNQVKCVWVPSMANLGRACGIDVGAAAAAAVD